MYVLLFLFSLCRVWNMQHIACEQALCLGKGQKSLRRGKGKAESCKTNLWSRYSTLLSINCWFSVCKIVNVISFACEKGCKHQKKSCTILAGGELQSFNKQSRTQKIEEKKTNEKNLRYRVWLQPGTFTVPQRDYTLPLHHRGWLRNVGKKSSI